MTFATSSPGSSCVPSGSSATYAHGGSTFSKTRAAASAPLRTPPFFAMMRASPIRSASTTYLVVKSAPPSSRPRSSRSAAATRSSSSLERRLERSGFDETIWFLAQPERLLAETEAGGALSAHVALLAGRFDDPPVHDLAPEAAAIDRKTQPRLVKRLELGDREPKRTH